MWAAQPSAWPQGMFSQWWLQSRLRDVIGQGHGTCRHSSLRSSDRPAGRGRQGGQWESLSLSPLSLSLSPFLLLS